MRHKLIVCTIAFPYFCFKFNLTKNQIIANDINKSYKRWIPFVCKNIFIIAITTYYIKYYLDKCNIFVSNIWVLSFKYLLNHKDFHDLLFFFNIYSNRTIVKNLLILFHLNIILFQHQCKYRSLNDTWAEMLQHFSLLSKGVYKRYNLFTF